MILQDDIKSELERQLGDGLSPQAWDYLVDDGWIRNVLWKEITIRELVREVRRLMSAWGRPIPQGSPRPRTLPSRQGVKAPKTVPERQDVISRLLAAEAADDEEVRSFRMEVLDGSTMKPEKVDKWIKRQAKEDGPPSLWLTVPVPKGTKVKSSTRAATTEPPLTISEKTPDFMVNMAA